MQKKAGHNLHAQTMNIGGLICNNILSSLASSCGLPQLPLLARFQFKLMYRLASSAQWWVGLNAMPESQNFIAPYSYCVTLQVVRCYFVYIKNRVLQ